MVHKLLGKWKVWQLFVVLTVLIVAVVSVALAGPTVDIESIVK